MILEIHNQSSSTKRVLALPSTQEGLKLATPGLKSDYKSDVQIRRAKMWLIDCL